ncbi:MAG: hypothetical protein R3Y38_04875 [Rikenellaceae bacterium]
MSKNEEKPQIKLPFTPSSVDIGEWAYDNRVGLLFAFVIGVICVISALYVTISIENARAYHAILIELEAEEELPQEREKPKPKLQEVEYTQVENQISNLNAQGLDQELTDDRHSSAKQIYESVTAMQEKADANKQLFERALAEDAAIRAGGGSDIKELTPVNIKVEGNVTVSFSFTDPVRRSVNIIVPAYMCEGGGMVVLEATLNTNGRVVSAVPTKRSTTTDNCMLQEAISAAKSSRFDVNSSAPERHKGEITYIFIPQ